MADSESKVYLREIAEQVGAVSESVQVLTEALIEGYKNGGSASGGGSKSSSKSSSSKTDDSIFKRLFPRGSKATDLFGKLFGVDSKKVGSIFDKAISKLFDSLTRRASGGKMLPAVIGGGMEGAFASMIPVITAATVGIKLFANAVGKAADASIDYRKSLNANMAALDKESKGSLEYTRAKEKETELVEKIANKTGAADFMSFFPQFKSMMLSLVRTAGNQFGMKDIPTSQILNADGTSMSQGQKSAMLADRMMSDDIIGLTEERKTSAYTSLIQPLTSAGLDYNTALDTAKLMAYQAFSYMKARNLEPEDFSNIVGMMASGLSSGSMYDVTTGVRLDDDILSGYAMKTGQVLPQYASDSILAKERALYLTQAYDKAVGEGAKAATDFAKNLKKTGEVMNDVQNTLFSFDEVIQLVAKVYEDVDGNVVQSIDKQMTAGVTGDSRHSEVAQLIESIQPGVRIGDGSIYGDNSGNTTINNHNYGSAVTPANRDASLPISSASGTSSSPGAFVYREALDDGSYGTTTHTSGSGRTHGGGGRKMGRGGIALSDVNATVGEAGKEAVIPLEHYNGVEYLANAMNEAAQSSGGSLGGDTVNVTLSGTILEMNDYNVRRLGQKLAAVIENNKRRNGGV